MPIKQLELIQSIQEAAEQPLDETVLHKLVGYNCRRAYLKILPEFNKQMAQFDLRPVEFTAISLLKANPNINQKRLSQALDVSPPNLAILLDRLEQRGLVRRQRNPMDKRSQTLTLTAPGLGICDEAEQVAAALELGATAALSEAERTELMRLLQKIYLPRAARQSAAAVTDPAPKRKTVILA
jgi:DNA-binding MarR family transcriptional regulator